MLRLIVALNVFYGHAVQHLNLTGIPILDYIQRYFPGVPLFFVLSGFLVWASIGRTPDMKAYIKKRVLRLYPELWIGVAISLISIIVLLDKVVWIDLSLFAVTQSTFLQFWTPDSLRGFGCNTPNGSLWTICTIVQFYILAWFIYRALKGKSPIKWAAILIAGIAFNFSPYLLGFFISPESVVFKLFRETIVPYFWLFMLGAFICEFFDAIMPFLKRFWWCGIVLLAATEALNLKTPGTYPVINSILAGFTWIGCAYAYPKLQIKHDISYGLYIYHMIIINIFIMIGFDGTWTAAVCALLISLVLAAISFATIGHFSRKKKAKLYG